MPFYVMLYREATPSSLGLVMAHIRQRLAESATAEPGRQNSRVFQRLGEPSHLLTVSEWSDEQSFAEFQASPPLQETNRIAGGPPLVTPLTPLIRAEYMARRASIVSCATLTVAPEHAPVLRRILTGEAHQRVKAVPGIVSREAYAARDKAGRFLVIHSWQALADLEAFRATVALDLDQLHAQLGAHVVSFTGGIAVDFSAFRAPPLRDHYQSRQGKPNGAPASDRTPPPCQR